MTKELYDTLQPLKIVWREMEQLERNFWNFEGCFSQMKCKVCKTRNSYPLFSLISGL